MEDASKISTVMSEYVTWTSETSLLQTSLWDLSNHLPLLYEVPSCSGDHLAVSNISPPSKSRKPPRATPRKRVRPALLLVRIIITTAVCSPLSFVVLVVS
jgi:hypothetical protein